MTRVQDLQDQHRRLMERRAAEIDDIRTTLANHLNDPALVGIMLAKIAIALTSIRHELYDIDVSIGEHD